MFSASPIHCGMSARVVIVTGASSGLGLQVARDLCQTGHDVILACRSEVKATAAVEAIRMSQPSALVTYMHVSHWRTM